jgi:hypothetical protein
MRNSESQPSQNFKYHQTFLPLEAESMRLWSDPTQPWARPDRRYQTQHKRGDRPHLYNRF